MQNKVKKTNKKTKELKSSSLIFLYKKKNHRHYEMIFYSLAQTKNQILNSKQEERGEIKVSVKLKPIIVILVKCSFTWTLITEI